MPLDDVSEGLGSQLIREQRVRSAGLSLAVRQRGEPGRPPVLLLHGYPDSQEVWNGVAQRLARDFHVISYDVRGAGRSDRPARVADYRLEQLADDLRAVIAAVSPDRPVHLVAHDWGSIQAWEAMAGADAARHFASFTSISGPCIDHVGEYLRGVAARSPQAPLRPFLDQFPRSWYILMFQLPGLAPLVWRAGFGRLWPAFLARTEGIVAEASATQTEDGAFGPRLYRANFLRRLLRPQPRTVEVPTQVLSLRDDAHVASSLLRSLLDFQRARLPRLRLRELPGGHWLPLAQPERLAELVRDWVLSQESGPL
ncbi:MAG: alpha/beta fold hydrolase [Stagnimonas sp.]|nr:alpha/beta fold hydrolase [Stagnimonas sp.]